VREGGEVLIEASTSIITKEGWLPLRKAVRVRVGVEGEGEEGKEEGRTVVVEHRQEMDGDRVKGGGIGTEFLVSYE